MDRFQLNRSHSSTVREKQKLNEKSKGKRQDTYHQREIHSVKNYARHPENNVSALPVSPRKCNRLRVEEMYKAHQMRAASRTTVSGNVQPVSSADLSPRRCYNQQQQRSQENNSPDSILLQTLVKEVRELKKIVTKSDRRFVENDRRLTRLEVTANKTFIVLGDVSNAINARMLLGNTLPREDKPPKGFYPPKLPIKRMKELFIIDKDLQNQNFFNYLVGHLFSSFVRFLFTIFTGEPRERILLLQQFDRHSYHDGIFTAIYCSGCKSFCRAERSKGSARHDFVS